MLSIPKNVYNSPDLPGDLLLEPSRIVHKFLWKNTQKTLSVKGVAVIASEIALQALVSVATVPGFLIKLTGIPFIFYKNNKMKPEPSTLATSEKTFVIEKHEVKGPSRIGIAKDDGKITKEVTVTYKGKLSEEEKERKQQFTDLRTELDTAINALSWKFMRVIDCNYHVMVSKSQDQAKAKLEIEISRHLYPGEVVLSPEQQTELKNKRESLTSSLKTLDQAEHDKNDKEITHAKFGVNRSAQDILSIIKFNKYPKENEAVKEIADAAKAALERVKDV